MTTTAAAVASRPNSERGQPKSPKSDVAATYSHSLSSTKTAPDKHRAQTQDDRHGQHLPVHQLLGLLLQLGVAAVHLVEALVDLLAALQLRDQSARPIGRLAQFLMAAGAEGRLDLLAQRLGGLLGLLDLPAGLFELLAATSQGEGWTPHGGHRLRRERRHGPVAQPEPLLLVLEPGFGGGDFGLGLCDLGLRAASQRSCS